MITLSTDWTPYIDANMGRMLLWRAGFRMRRLDADHLGLYLQPEEAGQNRNRWKSVYVGRDEVETLPAVNSGLTLDVDEGYFDGTLHQGGAVATSYGGQEVLSTVSVFVLIIRRLSENWSWTPSDTGKMGRKRTDSEHWRSIIETLRQHPEWHAALGIEIAP